MAVGRSVRGSPESLYQKIGSCYIHRFLTSDSPLFKSSSIASSCIQSLPLPAHLPSPDDHSAGFLPHATYLFPSSRLGLDCRNAIRSLRCSCIARGTCLSSCRSQYRSGQGVQRHLFEHGPARSGPVPLFCERPLTSSARRLSDENISRRIRS